MSLKSVNDILDILQVQSKFEEQPFQRLLKIWPEVVGDAIAQHTRPLLIQRDVLRVATSSAAWAQNLTFERQRLLLKLNSLMPTPIVDIRFSTAGWQLPPNTIKHQTILLHEHPSYLGDEVKDGASKTYYNPKTAFDNLAKTLQARAQHLPLCPQCQSPTPPGELQRWSVCAICATKKFSG
jgi:predicted nucleic acid-binding Zn ribbon protein